jgi:hypothetical protein
MIDIITTWKKYFENHHEGLGTTYERFILHKYFCTMKDQYSIKRVIEVPSFGMTGVSGINSLWWAINKCHVTVIDNNQERIRYIRKLWDDRSFKGDIVYWPSEQERLPFDNNSFDLAWNFAALWFLKDLERFLIELTRITKRVIFLCVPNNSNPFFSLRKILSKNREILNLEYIRSSTIKNIMGQLNWILIEQGYLDTPPWPDIAMNKEDLFGKLGIANILKTGKGENNTNYISILDYFSGEKPEMEDQILKYGWLEDSPRFVQKFWAHHRYFIFEKGK